ncbi:hypothetical protein EGW08_010989, partial [Elysia chlorotica]
ERQRTLSTELDKSSNGYTPADNVVKREQPGVGVARQFCPFCSNSVAFLSRHLTRVHRKEPDVAKVLKLQPPGLKESKCTPEMSKLRCLGNFMHNVEVLRGSLAGDIVVVRRSCEDRPASDYLPCMYCYAFMLPSRLSDHGEACELRDRGERNDYGAHQALSKYLLTSA